MKHNKKSDVVVVTGASAGVGRAVIRKFAKFGCKIGMIARGLQGLEGAKRDVEELGGKALIFQADVSDANAVEKAATAIEETFGPIDIWINNAMTTIFSEFADISAEEFKRVTEVTYLGFVYGTMAALRKMKERKRGVIVQVGSALAYRGIPLQSAYCGAKHAIQGFTESIRSEILHDQLNIHLTMVQMPALNTPQFKWCKTNFDKKPQPVPPIYQPEVAAEAVYYAAYHRRREMYVGFRNTIILIGNKFFPGFGDRYLARTGYSSQMLDENIDPKRPSNLWKPVEGDFGAHGDFNSRAINQSWQLKFDIHRNLIISAVIVIALAITLWTTLT